MFKVDLAAESEGATRHIDIAKCMSMVNRKLYRQQGAWHVLGAKAFAQNKVGGASPKVAVPFKIAIRGAPRSWVARNALVKGFSFWKEQQKLAYDEISPSIKPQWQDFKVYLNDTHRLGTEITPVSGDMYNGSDPYIAGEWVHSRLVYTIEDLANPGQIETHEPELMIMGPDATNPEHAVSLIRQYQISRARVLSPDPSIPGSLSDSIYSQSAAGGNVEQIIEITENLENSNDEPPYDVDNYPGGASNATDLQNYACGATLNGTLGVPTPTNPLSAVNQYVTLNGFTAVNGLLQLDITLDKAEADVGEFWLQLVIGKREAY